MKPFLNNMQVALTAALLVSLPAIVFWSVGAFDLPPSEAFRARELPWRVPVGSAAEGGGATAQPRRSPRHRKVQINSGTRLALDKAQTAAGMGRQSAL